jgi:polysaccharide export outer membrane protein
MATPFLARRLSPLTSLAAAAGLALSVSIPAGAQTLVAQATTANAKPVPTTPNLGKSVAVPTEYVIGPEDVLGVVFWRDTEMTGDVTVRPDGRITLPLIGDIDTTGLTPDQLKTVIHKAATKLIEDPTITVVVRQINSRKVFVTGSVTTPGAYPLVGPRTVMQAIALAGGLTEYADKKNITVMRMDNGQQKTFRFNYNEVAKGRRLDQNIVLKPGDTIVVP